MAGNAPDLASAVNDMNRAMTCLALELPESVWKDVADKYEALRHAYAHQFGVYERRINQLELEAF